MRRRRTPPKRATGQSLVEFALALPLFMLFICVTIQFSLILITYYSETRMARETARWLAVHSRTTTDTALLDHVRTTMLPGLRNGAAPYSPSSFGNDSATESNGTVGGMTVRFTPCGVSSNPCSNSNRVAGQMLYVEMDYNAANIIFLPTTFRLGYLSVKIPTALPPYRIYTMVE